MQTYRRQRTGSCVRPAKNLTTSPWEVRLVLAPAVADLDSELRSCSPAGMAVRCAPRREVGPARPTCDVEGARLLREARSARLAPCAVLRGLRLSRVQGSRAKGNETSLMGNNHTDYLLGVLAQRLPCRSSITSRRWPHSPAERDRKGAAARWRCVRLLPAWRGGRSLAVAAILRSRLSALGSIAIQHLM